MRRKEVKRLNHRDAVRTRAINDRRKVKERARRDARMLERIKADDPPYTPEVMSWLSAKLGKPSSKITPEDVSNLNP